MAFPTDTDHGVALWKNVSGSHAAGYVQSSSFKKGYETVLNGKDESGKTTSLSQGNGNIKGSFEMLVFDSGTPPEPSDILTFESYLTGSISGWIVTDVDGKEQNTDYTRVTVSVEYWPGVAGA